MEEIAFEQYKIDEVLRKKVGNNTTRFLNSKQKPTSALSLTSPKQQQQQQKIVDASNNYYYLRSPQTANNSHRIVSSSMTSAKLIHTLTNNLSSSSLLKSPIKHVEQQQQQMQQREQQPLRFFTQQTQESGEYSIGGKSSREATQREGIQHSTAMVDRIFKTIQGKSLLFKQNTLVSGKLKDYKSKSTLQMIQMQAEEEVAESFAEERKETLPRERIDQIDFCLAELMERLEKEIVEPLVNGTKGIDGRGNDQCRFEKKYLSNVVHIVNEMIVSVLLRLGGEKNTVVFLEYVNAFLSWFFSLVVEEFDWQVESKVQEECELLRKKIIEQEEQIELLGREIEQRDKDYIELQRSTENLKSVFADEKNGLLRDILALEEKIEEVTNVDNVRDSSYQMNFKIRNLTNFISDLQKENTANENQLKDNLCSLGFSIMARGKQAVERDNQVRSDFSLFRIKDDSILQCFNDHPFLTAFVYNRVLQIEVKVRDTDAIESRLLNYMSFLCEENLEEFDCSELFMEFTITKLSTSQHDGFKAIEETVRYLERERTSPVCLFFIKLFGILGSSTPSRLAIKELISTYQKLQLTGSNAVDAQLVYSNELEQMLAHCISSSEALKQIRHYFSPGSPPKKFEKWTLLSQILVFVSHQDDIDKSEDIYNSLAVSTQETLDSFDEKVNYPLIKRIAQSINIKPFAFLNYLLQTFERYSKDRKKESNGNPSNGTSAQGRGSGQFINSSQIPKAMRDSFVNMSKFMNLLNLHRDTQGRQYQQQQLLLSVPSEKKINSLVFDGDNVMESIETHRSGSNQQVLMKGASQTIRAEANRSRAMSSLKKVQNSLKLAKLRRSPTVNKTDESSLDSSQNSKFASTKRAK